MVLRDKKLIAKQIALVLCLLWSSLSYGQQTVIDTLPFTVDKSLLVIEGKLNGAPTRFAFDTGATLGVATSKNMDKAHITETGSDKKVIDANQTVSKLKRIKIDSLRIGRFEAKNLQAVSFDMPYLFCNELFLLGQDFIQTLNWTIDFDKSLVYVSNRPFEVSTDAQTWDIKNLARPTINFKVGHKTFKNCLIDFGYAGVFDVDMTNAALAEMATNQPDKVTESVTTGMGLMGWGKPKRSKNWVLDSIEFQGVSINNISVNLLEGTDTKLGIQFFRRYCHRLVLNHGEGKYHLYPQSEYMLAKEYPYDLKVAYKEGKLVVIGKNISDSSTASSFELGEELKAINNRSIEDFPDECSFLNWYMFELSGDKVLVEKLGGEKIWVSKGVLR